MRKESHYDLNGRHSKIVTYFIRRRPHFKTILIAKIQDWTITSSTYSNIILKTNIIFFRHLNISDTCFTLHISFKKECNKQLHLNIIAVFIVFLSPHARVNLIKRQLSFWLCEHLFNSISNSITLLCSNIAW